MSNSSNGSVLRYADNVGRSLPYEVECWDTNGVSLVWVRIPAVAKGTMFTMHYGGAPVAKIQPRRVWSDYVGVWHMAEDGGVVADSSPNGIDARPVGVAASKQVAADGVFGRARVNSSDSRSYLGQSMLKIDDCTLLDIGAEFTMSGWVKMTLPTTADGLARIASRNRGGTYSPDWELAISGFDTLRCYAGSHEPVSATIPSAETNWVHIAAVFSGTNLTAYANGVKVLDAPIAAVKDTDNKLVFGSKEKAMVRSHFTGLFDEFRLRDAASSADWIKAESDQAKSVFLTVGAAE